MDLPTERPASAPAAAAARRAVFGLGVRELGVGAIALVALATGLWYRHRASANEREIAAVRAELAMRADALSYYREKFAAIKATAAQLHALSDAQTTEPARSWARERAKRFDALLAKVDRERDARLFADANTAIAASCADGDLAGARAQLEALPPATFPAPEEFSRLRRQLYEEPLASFSRQSPELYRMFRQSEADLAKRDELALRSEIASAGADNVTPQMMVKLDLLAAVAARDDPVVAEWSALASAIDYFETPNGETLAHWRKAQHALQAQDWQTATNEMQAIVNSKVRTRQPFRAAFGRVLLKSRPDAPAEAYPYLAEAAVAGDKQARAWLAQEDYRQRRYPQVQRWLEAAVADGDITVVPLLLEVYEKHGDAIGVDLSRRIGVLERVTDLPEAPPAAWLLLGRLYEAADPASGRASKALASYKQAAAKGSAVGHAEVARCALRGIGGPENLELARDEACRAFGAGEREKSVPLLLELLRRAPERAASAVQKLFEREQVATAASYNESRVVEGPGVAQLKAQLARYFDEAGMFGQAARFYAASRDPAAARRHAELTAAHACDTCGGTGKIQVSVPCPSCDGKGKQICSYCGGTGFIFVPGTPPCTTCGGSGTMIQGKRVVTCATCSGTGKGKGSVIKQDCTHCEHGYIRCTECTNGQIKDTKECPDCHGRGTWTMAERAGE